MTQTQELDLYMKRISRAINDVIGCLDKAPVDEWNWKPTATGNSLFALAVHVIGSTEEHIIEGVCGQPVGRDRDAEFMAEGADATLIHDRWQAVQSNIREALGELPEGALDADCHDPRLEVMSGRSVMLIVAQHVAEHRGHAELTLDLLTTKLGQAPEPR